MVATFMHARLPIYRTWEKNGEFGELWAIRQYFTRQLFLSVILLATEVTFHTVLLQDQPTSYLTCSY